MLASMRAVDFINIKLMKCGGIYNAIKINAVAEASGISCMIGCMGESALANVAGMHVAAALDNIKEVDLDSVYILSDKRAHGGFDHEGGKAVLWNTPASAYPWIKVRRPAGTEAFLRPAHQPGRAAKALRPHSAHKHPRIQAADPLGRSRSGIIEIVGRAARNADAVSHLQRAGLLTCEDLQDAGGQIQALLRIVGNPLLTAKAVSRQGKCHHQKIRPLQGRLGRRSQKLIHDPGAWKGDLMPAACRLEGRNGGFLPLLRLKEYTRSRVSGGDFPKHSQGRLRQIPLQLG